MHTDRAERYTLRREPFRQSHTVPGIFICYRRDDSAGFAGRLYDRLERRFGDDHIFMDASIKPGDDFVKLIEERLSSCDVLIALMGKKWLTARKGRRRRLDDPLDFVRLEIETGGLRGIEGRGC